MFLTKILPVLFLFININLFYSQNNVTNVIRTHVYQLELDSITEDTLKKIIEEFKMLENSLALELSNIQEGTVIEERDERMVRREIFNLPKVLDQRLESILTAETYKKYIEYKFGRKTKEQVKHFSSILSLVDTQQIKLEEIIFTNMIRQDSLRGEFDKARNQRRKSDILTLRNLINLQKNTFEQQFIDMLAEDQLEIYLEDKVSKQVKFLKIKQTSKSTSILNLVLDYRVNKEKIKREITNIEEQETEITKIQEEDRTELYRRIKGILTETDFKIFQKWAKRLNL